MITGISPEQETAIPAVHKLTYDDLDAAVREATAGQGQA
jgi:hypothetical protein